MPSSRPVNKLVLVLAVISTLTRLTAPRRIKPSRRGELTESVPLAASNWTVPLEGGQTCSDASHCTDQLPGPPLTSSLLFLAIGKGTITYNCAGQPPNRPPIYITQDAALYNATPLVSKFSSEDQFHSYIPRFLEYDYTSLDNSSLNCMGTVQRVEDLTVFTLYTVDAFPVLVKQTINSPRDPQFDLSWAHSQDDMQQWDIYRVETASGGSPYDCGGQIINDEIPVEYVAEYWFYYKAVGGHDR